MVKRSAYDHYVRHHESARVPELLARNDVTVARMMRADAHHTAAVAETQEALRALGVRFTVRTRDRMDEITDVDLVITVGGDGTLLAVSHAVGAIPMLGVNSAPLDSVGFLCAARMGDVRSKLAAILEGRAPRVTLARMAVRVDGELQHERVLNDALFAHPHPASTSRYLLTAGDRTEEQRSSGIWVSTATGSTAAIRSAGGRVMPLRSRALQYRVREPYSTPQEPLTRLGGVLREGETLLVANKMREARVYIDGPRSSLKVEIGQRVSFERSRSPLVLFGISEAGEAARG